VGQFNLHPPWVAGLTSQKIQPEGWRRRRLCRESSREASSSTLAS